MRVNLAPRRVYPAAHCAWIATLAIFKIIEGKKTAAYVLLGISALMHEQKRLPHAMLRVVSTNTAQRAPHAVALAHVATFAQVLRINKNVKQVQTFALQAATSRAIAQTISYALLL